MRAFQFLSPACGAHCVPFQRHGHYSKASLSVGGG